MRLRHCGQPTGFRYRGVYVLIAAVNALSSKTKKGFLRVLLKIKSETFIIKADYELVLR